MRRLRGRGPRKQHGSSRQEGPAQVCSGACIPGAPGLKDLLEHSLSLALGKQPPGDVSGFTVCK